MHPVGARIKLLQRDAFGKGRDGQILLQGGRAFIHEGHDRGVEFMLDGKHGPQLRTGVAACLAPIWGHEFFKGNKRLCACDRQH